MRHVDNIKLYFNYISKTITMDKCAKIIEDTKIIIYSIAHNLMITINMNRA